MDYEVIFMGLHDSGPEGSNDYAVAKYKYYDTIHTTD